MLRWGIAAGVHCPCYEWWPNLQHYSLGWRCSIRHRLCFHDGSCYAYRGYGLRLTLKSPYGSHRYRIYALFEARIRWRVASSAAITRSGQRLEQSSNVRRCNESRTTHVRSGIREWSSKTFPMRDRPISLRDRSSLKIGECSLVPSNQDSIRHSWRWYIRQLVGDIRCYNRTSRHKFADMFNSKRLSSRWIDFWTRQLSFDRSFCLRL